MTHGKDFALFFASLLVAVGPLVASCAPAASPAPTAKPAAKAEPTAAAKAAATTPATGPTATPKPAADQPRPGGVLTRTNPEDPAHLDVHQATAVSAQLGLANVYNGLVRFAPVDVNKVIPDIAERWEVSADARVFTFRLRQGVKWHDGKPFTSEDARFSLERMAFWKENKIISPRGGAMLSGVEKVETPDANTVKVTLKYPSASFLGNAASGWVLVLPKHVLQAKGDMKKDAIGTGPFKWKSWNFGVSQELVKNPDYFMKGLPYLDGVTIYPIKDESTRFAAFRTGQVRMTGIASKALTHAQAAQVRKEMGDKVVVVTHPAAMRHLFFMNFKKKPWDDIRVRQAIDLAFDRQAALAVNSGVGMLGAAMHPKGAWGIPEDEMAKMPGFGQPKDRDIAKAKSLLAEAGYPSGFKTEVIIRTGGISEAEGVVAKDHLAKIGVDVSLKIVDSATHHSRLDQHDFDSSFLLASDPTDDPDAIFSAYYITGGSMNFGQFSDKQVDELFAKQTAMLDEAERKKVVIDIQKRILELAAYSIVFWDAYNMGFWREVRGYKPGFGPYTHNSLDRVWLAK
ncbi:MAG: hypothetical protein HYX92_01630 [Chloroflexi bacterium]|nr:hypothetical protein [Chloroflexota bacterium]